MKIVTFVVFSLWSVVAEEFSLNDKLLRTGNNKLKTTNFYKPYFSNLR